MLLANSPCEFGRQYVKTVLITLLFILYLVFDSGSHTYQLNYFPVLLPVRAHRFAPESVIGHHFTPPLRLYSEVFERINVQQCIQQCSFYIYVTYHISVNCTFVLN